MSKTRTRKFAYTVGQHPQMMMMMMMMMMMTTTTTTVMMTTTMMTTTTTMTMMMMTTTTMMMMMMICRNALKHSACPLGGGTLADWQQLFLITGVVHIVDVIIFDIIAKAELQPWAGGAGSDEGSLVAQASSSLDAYEETSLLGDETKPTYYGAVTTERGHTPGKLQIEGF
nr:hypothetical protein BaRGS_033031 [Batillaria attramentaria]